MDNINVFQHNDMLFHKIAQGGEFYEMDDSRKIKLPPTYITNNTVSERVGHLFFQSIIDKAKAFNNYYGKDSMLHMTKYIAFILTQEKLIIVRYEKWLYMYDGYIYTQIEDDTMLLPMIRELCENAAHIWNHFEVTYQISNRILQEIEQMAFNVDYPADIYRYIVFKNGILNLDTMLLEPHRTGLFITNMILADWIEDESCPHFDNIIDTYTQGDYILKNRLLEALGLCLTNRIVKKIICFVGVTNSGKSTLVNYLLGLFNRETTVTMQPNEFEERFAAGRIFGKSICACMDMEAEPLNARATAMLKNISGHDMIGAEFKYSNGSTMFVSRAHTILCSNYAIRSIREDIAFQNRLLIIPFQNSLKEDIIPLEKLMNSLQLETNAIVRKLIMAYLRLKSNNFIFSGTGDYYDSYIPPAGISMTVEECFKEFIESRCIITNSHDDYIFAEDLFHAYQKYASEYRKISFSNMNHFSKCVSIIINVQHNKKRKNRNSNPQSCYYGICFKDGYEISEF